MALVFGLATTLAAIAVAAVIWLAGFEVWSLSLLFVLPVGGALGGALCASGWYVGLRRAFVQPRRAHHAVAAALALAGWMGSYVAYYRLSGAGGFGDYLARTLESRFSAFWLGEAYVQLPTTPAPGSALAVAGSLGFVMEGVGFVLGALVTGFSIWQGVRVCPCGRGMRRRDLVCYASGTPPEAPAELVAWLDANRRARGLPDASHARIEVDLCTRVPCREGALVVAGHVIPLSPEAAWAVKRWRH